MPKPINKEEFNQSVRPTDDFFAYVNSSWIKNNPIPPEEAQWGSFNLLRIDVEKKLKAIFEELDAAPDSALDANARKIRDFYRTGMNVEKLNADGDAPLVPIMDRIEAIKNNDDLVREVGYLHRHGMGAFWQLVSEPDAKDSKTVALYMYQSGLGLPDRDYYLKTDENSALIRKKYAEYIETMAKSSAPDFTKNIIDLETGLAAASMTRVELRDIEKQYNKMTPAELAAITPNINWKLYFDAIGISMPEYMIVCQPEFMKIVNKQFEKIPIEQLKDYLRWHALNALAGYLSEEREKQIFNFYDKTFHGTTEMKSRSRRVIAVVNAMLDEAVGKIYVERHFSESAKNKIRDLVEHLTSAYRARIEALDWMGPDTKAKALTKLAAITKKLAYPDVWKNFFGLTIEEDSYAANYERAYEFEFNRLMQKIGKPVDRSEWFMSPQTVNAGYNPLSNEILFPAAILQPPFFDPEADDAVNFGGIGMAIGHELTHGFDDQGALFDFQGNLFNWWTPEDKLRFDKHAEHLAEQFDAYEVLPGLYVNGKLTLGENIADLGGILIAYDGLTLALQGKPQETIDGLTPYERFFINYAISERQNTREEAVRLHVQTNPHSPSMYRVNGPSSNLEEFYATFGTKEGDKLWRPQKIA